MAQQCKFYVKTVIIPVNFFDPSLELPVGNNIFVGNVKYVYNIFSVIFDGTPKFQTIVPKMIAWDICHPSVHNICGKIKINIKLNVIKTFL